MKTVPLWLLLALPACAQFQFMEITFQGVGCASCVESLPARVQRMRGVESASVDGERGVLTVRLASQNRVRLEQVRDMVEQDGTRTVRATVRVAGELKREADKMILQPAGLPSNYEIAAPPGAPPSPGSYIVSGQVDVMRPESGTLVIRATQIRNSE